MIKNDPEVNKYGGAHDQYVNKYGYMLTNTTPAKNVFFVCVLC